MNTSSNDSVAVKQTRREVTVPMKSLKVSAERRRAADLDFVGRLARSIKVSGLLQRIGVGLDGTVHYGVHRFLAFEQLGRDEIEALVFENYDADHVALFEIEENLQRAELTVLEKGEHLLEHEEIWKRRGFCDKLSQNPFGGRPRSFIGVTAELTGESRRSLERATEIARGIAPEARALLRGTAAANNQWLLKKIVHLSQAEQVRVARELGEGKHAVFAPDNTAGDAGSSRARSQPGISAGPPLQLSPETVPVPPQLSTERAPSESAIDATDRLHNARIALSGLREIAGLPADALPVIEAAIGTLRGGEGLVETALSGSAAPEPAQLALAGPHAVVRADRKQATDVVGRVCEGVESDTQEIAMADADATEVATDQHPSGIVARHLDAAYHEAAIATRTIAAKLREQLRVLRKDSRGDVEAWKAHVYRQARKLEAAAEHLEKSRPKQCACSSRVNRPAGAGCSKCRGTGWSSPYRGSTRKSVSADAAHAVPLSTRT